MTRPPERSSERSPGRPGADVRLGFSTVLSDDGTALQVWTNDPDGVIEGPTVLLCNGLGTNPYAWPGFLDPSCTVRVVSWYHRGTGGSERPRDPRRVGVEAFVEDGLSVMDHFGIDRAVLVGWSIGVNTMFELAAEHPERVSGLFAVAGVPGDTFSTMLGPLLLPRPVAKAITVTSSRLIKLAGRGLTPVVRRVPVDRRTIGLLGRTGVLLPVRHPELAARALEEFRRTPVEWYFHLALSAARHRRVSLRRIQVPVLFVGGTWDVLAGARHMAQAADRLTQAAYVEVRASHFIPLEQPELVSELLTEFLTYVEDGASSEES